MANPFLDLLGDVGYALDTPGAYLRGALSGQVGQRASGQDMLGSWGLDAGPLGGMAAEMVLDPLMLAGMAGGAVKGLQGINAATRGARAVAGLGEAAPMARRLAELKGGVETPLDAVRFASRQGESSNPIMRGIAGFAGDETGAVDMDAVTRLLGGDRRAAYAAAVQGPGYPGGADKLRGMMQQADIHNQSALRQVFDLPESADFVASEIPEGSQFLGSGQSAAAFRTPMDSVVRVNRGRGSPDARLNIPEVLQPFRSVYQHGYNVEHLPFVQPLGTMTDTERSMEAAKRYAGSADKDLLFQLAATRDNAWSANDAVQSRIIRDLANRGIHEADWHDFNVGLTGEGKIAAFDPGVFTAPVGRRDLRSRRLIPTETDAYMQSLGGRAEAAGVPDLIRETLARDAEIGAAGQGVPAPELAAARPDLLTLLHLNRMMGRPDSTVADWRMFARSLRGG